ncbi:MAG: hypothetical protein ABR575_11915 [Actinomycetota bacterium]
MGHSDAAATGMDYDRARRLLLVGGLVVLLLTAAVMYARRVDTAEVLGTLLFVPVFVALVLWGVRGGLAAGAAAAAAYAALRYPAIEAVGLGRFGGLLVSRALAYVAFGGIGGWAAQQLEGSLSKLELYDQIDDATGLFNARFFVQETELEMARAQRYQTLFSVALVEVPDAGVAPGRQGARAVKDLAKLLRDSVRTVDRAVYARDGEIHLFAVVLPETAAEGARTFTDRLADRVRETLSGRGGAPAPPARAALTYPGEDEALAALRARFEAIDRREHPQAHRS